MDNWHAGDPAARLAVCGTSDLAGWLAVTGAGEAAGDSRHPV